jgi:two-component system cell cycle response regulator
LSRVVRRPADLVARYGGEEFALVLPFTDKNGATVVSLNLQQEMRRLGLPHARSNVSQFVTVSLGVASIVPNLDIAPEKLVKNADTALYAAKRQGRNRWVCLEIGE